jgi:hypothetical protein
MKDSPAAIPINKEGQSPMWVLFFDKRITDLSSVNNRPGGHISPRMQNK